RESRFPSTLIPPQIVFLLIIPVDNRLLQEPLVVSVKELPVRVNALKLDKCLNNQLAIRSAVNVVTQENKGFFVEVNHRGEIVHEASEFIVFSVNIGYCYNSVASHGRSPLPTLRL